jgi:hypothetical protein
MDPQLRRKERARGYILKILLQSYPNATDAEVVYFTLNDLGFTMDKAAYDFHIGYLVEKGLVKEEKRTAGKRISLRMLSATSRGVDVMDGRCEECGVDIEL